MATGPQYTYTLKPVQAFKWPSRGLTDCSWPLIAQYAILKWSFPITPPILPPFFLLNFFAPLFTLSFNLFFSSHRHTHSTETYIHMCLLLSPTLWIMRHTMVSERVLRDAQCHLLLRPVLHFRASRGKLPLIAPLFRVGLSEALKGLLQKLGWHIISEVNGFLSYTLWLYNTAQIIEWTEDTQWLTEATSPVNEGEMPGCNRWASATEITGFKDEEDGRINLIDGSTVSIDLPSDATLQGAC